MDPEVSVLAFDPSAFEPRSVGVSHRVSHRYQSSEAVFNLETWYKIQVSFESRDKKLGIKTSTRKQAKMEGM